MVLTPARIRALVIPVVFVVGLLAPTTAFAAEAPTAGSSGTILTGAGVLAAHGDGQARLAGSYTLAGSLDGGTLSIRGIDRWSTVRVTGWTSKTRFADGTVLYRFGERIGQYVVAGRTLVTTIESDAIRFSAAGHGRAGLRGEGSYWVNGRGPFPWSDPALETEF